MYDVGKEWIDNHPSAKVSGTNKLAYKRIPVVGLFKVGSEDDDTRQLEMVVTEVSNDLGGVSGSMYAEVLDALIRYANQSKI
ncbi:hypothetical protein HYT55_04715 [Candidatus Woesearchaeota archaeon]|nr:hypothetical protein [Candidatus Woesearchaeota archaeon]